MGKTLVFSCNKVVKSLKYTLREERT
jgi:hypothetical protein